MEAWDYKNHWLTGQFSQKTVHSNFASLQKNSKTGKLVRFAAENQSWHPWHNKALE
jgi:arylamine N-acetyltransferase